MLFIRIVSIITGGMGVIDSTDITYATPYYWVEQHIKMDFPNTFYPITVLRYCRNVRPTWVRFNSKDTKESVWCSRF